MRDHREPRRYLCWSVGSALAVAVVAGPMLFAPAAVEAGAVHHSPGVVSATSVGLAGSVPSYRDVGQSNPHRNLPPHPNYDAVCATHHYTYPACIKAVLAAIRHARAVEHLKKPAMILPRNFTKLSAAEQTFVVTDLERVGRGQRPFLGLNRALDKASHVAAVQRRDPTVSGPVLRRLKIEQYGSIWAGDLGPLASDYDWMYNDGYSAKGGPNIDCVKPSSPGCWGHRDNILGTYSHLPTLIAGAGSGKPAGASLAELLAAGPGKPPTFVYTWEQALAHGANGHPIVH